MKELYLARDNNGDLFGYGEEPYLHSNINAFVRQSGSDIMITFPRHWFPQVTFNNSPVKLVLESEKSINTPKTQVKSNKRRR